MKSIVACNTFVLAFFMTTTSLASAYSTDKPPTVIYDPVLGLRFNIAKAQLEALPSEVFNACSDLVNENFDSKNWIFAKHESPAGTYYVLGGYMVHRDPVPAHAHKYESADNGVLMRVTVGSCEMIDPANGSFGEGSALPADILEPLAADLRRRLENGAGGRTRLRQAMRESKVGTDNFAPSAQRGFGKP